MDIKKASMLLDLGYSIEDIKALGDNVETQEPVQKNVQAENVPAVENVQATTLDVTAKPVQENVQATDVTAEQTGVQKNVQTVEDVFNDTFANINKQVEEFNKRMQSLNNKFAEMDEGKVATRTDSDIIASIIHPKTKEEL